MVHKVVRLVRLPVRCLVTIGGLSIASMAAHVAAHADRTMVAAQERTVWQGVYSAEQAERGWTAYERHCASCHGNDLAGGTARALSGESFMRNWSESNLYDLFDKIRSTMPPNMGRDLSDATYVDIVAYVLQRNTFPNGPALLAPDPDVLRHIRIQSREGPASVPSFALVKVFGCLERAVGDEWMLTRATDAVRTRLPSASENPGAELPDPTLTGDLTFRLFGIYPRPEVHVGHEVEVRGFLIRNATADRINVTSLRTVTPGCRVTHR